MSLFFVATLGHRAFQQRGHQGFSCLKKSLLVVDKDECREVLHYNLPHSLHSQLGIFHTFDALDTALRQHGSHTADGAQIEAAMLVACRRDSIRTVALGNHDQRCAMCLELVYIGVHTACCGRAH